MADRHMKSRRDISRLDIVSTSSVTRGQAPSTARARAFEFFGTIYYIVGYWQFWRKSRHGRGRQGDVRWRLRSETISGSVGSGDAPTGGATDGHRSGSGERRGRPLDRK